VRRSTSAHSDHVANVALNLWSQKFFLIQLCTFGDSFEPVKKIELGLQPAVETLGKVGNFYGTTRVVWGFWFGCRLQAESDRTLHRAAQLSGPDGACVKAECSMLNAPTIHPQ
jgi:hypothetical protein